MDMQAMKDAVSGYARHLQAFKDAENFLAAVLAVEQNVTETQQRLDALAEKEQALNERHAGIQAQLDDANDQAASIVNAAADKAKALNDATLAKLARAQKAHEDATEERRQALLSLASATTAQQAKLDDITAQIGRAQAILDDLKAQRQKILDALKG